jgi:hypothetical protein
LVIRKANGIRMRIDGLPPEHNIIKVAVAEVPVVHQVKAIEVYKVAGADWRFAARCSSAAAHPGDFRNAEFSTELRLEALTYR